MNYDGWNGEKDATIYEAILYPSRERGRIYLPLKSLLFCCPWHPDGEVRTAASAVREKCFPMEEGLLLSSLSLQFAACTPFAPLWSSSSSPCHGSVCICTSAATTAPICTSPFIPLICIAWCLSAVPSAKHSVGHTHYFHLAPGNFHSFMFYFTYAPAFCLQCGWMVWTLILFSMRNAFCFLLLQCGWMVHHWGAGTAEQASTCSTECVNTAVRPFMPLAFAQNTSLHV